MTGYSAQERQRIVEEFCARHDGRYDPAEFLAEVKARGRRHPAYAWFEFDTEEAAHQHNLWQARMFVRDLKVVFRIEEIRREGTVTVMASAPMAISPTAGRPFGGGYYLLDP